MHYSSYTLGIASVAESSSTERCAIVKCYSLEREQCKVDSYGFEHPEDYDEKAQEEFMSQYLTVLVRRAVRWTPILIGKEKISKSRKLKRFCRKGIPSEHRPLVWMESSGAAERMRADPGFYRQLLAKELDPSVEDAIMLDIHRTFPENIYFVDSPDSASLQKPLKNVLVAFAQNNPHMGYCQGINFIAGMMLLILRSEEKAFWLLDTLTRRLIPDYYAADMIAVKAEQELLGDIIKWKMPDLQSHLHKSGLHWSLVCMKWFICLYADVLPVETVLRIWDSLFYEGWKVLLRVALTLVKKNSEQLMAVGSFTDALAIFKTTVSQPVVLDCHSFMESVFKDTGSMPTAKLQKMREQCTRRILAES